jgi:hypothetical protein
MDVYRRQMSMRRRSKQLKERDHMRDLSVDGRLIEVLMDIKDTGREDVY